MDRRHPLSNCEDCPLFDKGNAFVPSLLPQGARVALVGEAPGYQEGREGIPFAGPSGKLLDMVLEKRGLNRNEMVLTNATLCRTPDNAAPSATAVRCCRPRLEAELAEVDTIVAMGNTATGAILKKDVKITQERVGPAKKIDYNGREVRLIPTIHPSACLRVSDFFPYLMSDLDKVNATDQEPWEVPEIQIMNDPFALDSLPDTIIEVAVDIETGVEKDDVFTHPSELLCVGLSWNKRQALVLSEEFLATPVGKDALRRFLRGKNIVCHNGKFDLQVLKNLGYCDDDVELYFDTMLASYTTDERPGTNSLDFNGQEILGTPNWKGVIGKYLPNKQASYSNVPRDILYEYNAYDVAVTFELFELFQEFYARPENDDLRRAHDMMVMFSNALTDVERDGIRIDLPYNRELTERYGEILDPLEEALKPWVNNPRSWKQIKEALIVPSMRPHNHWDTIDKIPSTDADHLEEYMEIGVAKKKDGLVKFCQLLLEYRKEHKLFSTYVKGITKRVNGGRVYPTYLLHGTTSGRSACRNPNVQNVARSPLIRKQFVPDLGNVFVQGDYSGAELRVVSVESGDEYLQANLDGWNRMVAAQLFGDNYDSEQYVRGKAMVHGTNYGRESYSIAVEFDMPEAEAEKYQSDYKKMIPGVVAWQEDIKRQVLAGRTLTTPFGRRRRYWLVTKDNQKDIIKEALSFKPQSIASDINFHALVALHERFERDYRGVAFVRIPVHDSVLTECREDLRDEIAEVVRTTMEAAALKYTDKVPFKVDIEWGYNWGEKNELGAPA